MIFKKIAIVGLGLIGGSIAKSIRKNSLAETIIGVSRSKKTVAFARKQGIIDHGSVELDILKDADMVILATPVEALLKLAPKISRVIKKGCLVTDVGSTKSQIVSKLNGLFGCFVGSHPLAGSEKRSIIHAEDGLLEGSICIITPSKSTSKTALKQISAFWKAAGMRVCYMPADKHDRILAAVSHLPHIIAFSLINSVPSSFLGFSATSLRDTTRIAASDRSIWSDIFMTNRENLLEMISAFEKELNKLKRSIRQKKPSELKTLLRSAARKRERLTR